MARLIRILLSTSLAPLLVLTMSASSPAKSKVEWQTYSSAQLKAAMATLGTGEHARVIVTLQDGTQLTGYVSQANDSRFMVVGKGEATPVDYTQVADIRAGNPDTQVKFAARITTMAAAIAAQTPPPVKPHHGHQGLSHASKIALVLALTAAGIVASLALAGVL